MSRVDTAMSRWLVYAQTHGLLPLDMRVFPPILERLRTYLQACVGPSINKDSSNSGKNSGKVFKNPLKYAKIFVTSQVQFTSKAKINTL